MKIYKKKEKTRRKWLKDLEDKDVEASVFQSA